MLLVWKCRVPMYILEIASLMHATLHRRVVQGFLADIFGAVPVIRGMAVLSALLTATLYVIA